jgi:hypothetical protein
MSHYTQLMAVTSTAGIVARLEALVEQHRLNGTENDDWAESVLLEAVKRLKTLTP